MMMIRSGKRCEVMKCRGFLQIPPMLLRTSHTPFDEGDEEDDDVVVFDDDDDDRGCQDDQTEEMIIIYGWFINLVSMI